MNFIGMPANMDFSKVDFPTPLAPKSKKPLFMDIFNFLDSIPLNCHILWS